MNPLPRVLVLCALILAIAYPAAQCAELDVIPKEQATEIEGSPLLWYDLRALDVEGKGWTDTESFYDRLPAKAKGKVPNSVWGLSLASAGMSARFTTDATAISARWKLRQKRIGMHHMAPSGVSSLDLYVRHESAWRWLGYTPAREFPSNEGSFVTGLSPESREYQIYLPLYNGVEEVLIGLPKEATLSKAPTYPKDKRKPIVFYGTSITQGACASRPGMAYPAIIGRRLNRPTINLGFSGNGRMQPGVEAIFPELDAVLFVIDCLPNMGGSEVRERALPFLRTLRERHPATPIILTEDRDYGQAFLRKETRDGQTDRRNALRETYDTLQAEGVPNLHYIPATGQIGTDGEALVDGSHPNDLGMMRLADAFAPVIEEVLEDTE